VSRYTAATETKEKPTVTCAEHLSVKNKRWWKAVSVGGGECINITKQWP